LPWALTFGLCEEMTTWEFFKRAGFSNETFAHRLEEEGYVLARSLQGLDEAKFKDVGIGCGPEEPKLRRILKLVGAKDEHAADVRGMALASETIVRNEFLRAFPNASREQARAFSYSLYNHRSGLGRVSTIQLRAYLDSLTSSPLSSKGDDESESKDESKGGDEQASPETAMAGISSMLEPEKKAPAPRPTPAEPTHWVYLWCKRVGVEDVASNFADNEMTSREDVFAEPALTRNDLKAIGINKLGMQRRVLRLIEIERGLSHDGDEQVFDALTKARCDAVSQAGVDGGGWRVGRCLVAELRERDLLVRRCGGYE